MRLPFCGPLFAFLVLTTSPVLAQTLPAQAEAYLGEWRVTDEDTGEPEAVMEIYVDGGKVHGRLVRSLGSAGKDDGAIRCKDCHGGFDGADLRGIPLLRDLEWDGDSFEDGIVLDPRTGKRYRLSLTLGDDGRLHVRGYKGIKLLGKTQVWERGA